MGGKANSRLLDACHKDRRNFNSFSNYFCIIYTMKRGNTTWSHPRLYIDSDGNPMRVGRAKRGKIRKALSRIIKRWKTYLG